MNDSIKIVSANCQGLNDVRKRNDVFQYLKNKRGNIYCLQDTHFTEKLENKIKQEWGSSTVIFSSYTSNSRGVAILFLDNFEFQVLKKIHDPEKGNYITLKIKIQDELISLTTIYGPNNDSPDFYDTIKTNILELDTETNIICGDFNLVQDQTKDTFNYKHVNNPNAKKMVLSMKEELDLYDPWRENNIDIKRFTWRKSNPVKQARLDYFLVSRNLENSIVTSKIDTSYRSDHSSISISLKFSKLERGTGFWKFNNSLLRDADYVKLVKKIIDETNKQYFVKNGKEEHTHSIDDQLLFEILLCNIRGETIKYCSYKKESE